jgi:hypothetical protein
MERINEHQIRHEKLIDFLSQFNQYQYDGKPRLKKVKEQLSGSQADTIDTNDIRSAVIVFCDTLNISGGSSGDMELFSLLQTYLTNLNYRKKINEVISESILNPTSK